MVLHLAVDSVQVRSRRPSVVEQTVRVVDHVGVGTELREAFDVRATAGEEITAFVVEPFTGEPDEPGGSTGSIELRTEGREDHMRVTRAELADRLLSMINQHRLMEVDDGPHLHSSAVVDAEGRALVAVARSHGGKSTFAAHLLHRGLSLVNDEQTRLLPEHDLVASFRRPLAIKARGVEHLPIALPPVTGAPDTRLVPPSALGARWEGSGHPALVVVLARDEDHDGPAEVRWLAPSEVVAACCANNLDLARDPERGLQAFAWLASTAAGVELTYRSSADAAAVAVDLLGEAERRSVPYAVEWDDQPADDAEVGAGSESIDAVRPSDEVDVHEVEVAAGVPVHAPGAGGRSAAQWRRSADVVTVGIGGEVVLYHRGSRTVARLNAGAAQRWVGLGEDVEEADDEDTDRLWRQLADEELVVPVGSTALAGRSQEGLGS